ncbi:hypothetical protein M3G50_09405 [Brachybacterium muris]|uniref:hypothetical protein n=1 Tax=Brachybacterium muris TaxID=219301 RepID=UPI0021A817E8|nr:hypothetical protein [Brachybacterium muris]MCT1430962.1 hypothetical protein [Brachybacterium muris]
MRTLAYAVRKVLNDVFDQLEASSEDERKLLTAQRDKLEAERLKLVQAHYADAIPLDLLKSEQDRIRASLDQITTRLDNLTDTYAEARTGLDQLTELLVDLDELYNKCEPAERRILNRALFTRITIDCPAPNWGTPAGQLLDRQLRFPLGSHIAVLRHICRTGYTQVGRAGWFACASKRRRAGAGALRVDRPLSVGAP